MKRLAIISLALLVSTGAAKAADKVRMSISAVDVSFLTGGLAFKRGMFRDEGLDVEVIRMNANVSITALSTGDIDADHASLKARGVDVDDGVMRMGDPVPPMFFFRDQDGNRLAIVEE